MGNFLTKLSNKLSFLSDKYLDDDEQREFEQNKKAQEAQDELSRKREQLQQEEDREREEKIAAEEKAAAELARRSEFNVETLFHRTCLGILKQFMGLISFLLMLYGGHISANEAIGYSISMRILSFVYGCLAFFIVIPRSFYYTFWLKKEQHFYTFLPISTHLPNGNFENFFLTPFCYVHDQYIDKAKAEILEQYKVAFENSRNIKRSPPPPAPPPPAPPAAPSAPASLT
jgi:hypothetical protein